MLNKNNKQEKTENAKKRNKKFVEFFAFSLLRSYSVRLRPSTRSLIREFKGMYKEHFNGVANYVDDGNFCGFSMSTIRTSLYDDLFLDFRVAN